MVPKARSPEPTETLPQSLPCLAADLLSSFLLIGVLFAISISLLYGVVKVRLVQGRRGQEQTPSCCPEYPHRSSYIHLGESPLPVRLQNLSVFSTFSDVTSKGLGRVIGGLWGSGVLTGDLHSMDDE